MKPNLPSYSTGLLNEEAHPNQWFHSQGIPKKMHLEYMEDSGQTNKTIDLWTILHEKWSTFATPFFFSPLIRAIFLVAHFHHMDWTILSWGHSFTEWIHKYLYSPGLSLLRFLQLSKKVDVAGKKQQSCAGTFPDSSRTCSLKWTTKDTKEWTPVLLISSGRV